MSARAPSSSGPSSGHPPIDADFVRRVAALARLQVDEGALEALTRQFGKILDLVSVVQSIEVGGAAKAGLPPVGPDALRDDVPGETLSRAEIRQNAPAHDGAFLVVPRVLATKGSSNAGSGSAGSSGANGGQPALEDE
jgi:aspartyl-tRNA(Asn)/glutamyl-tRNA(Gln) amidotransferase subunit C